MFLVRVIREYQVIDQRIFVALITMALITSRLGGPMIQRLLQSQRADRNFKHHFGRSARRPRAVTSWLGGDDLLPGLRRGDSSCGGTNKRTSVTFGGYVIVYNPMVQYAAAEMTIALEAPNVTIECVAHDWAMGVDHGGT